MRRQQAYFPALAWLAALMLLGGSLLLPACAEPQPTAVADSPVQWTASGASLWALYVRSDRDGQSWGRLSALALHAPSGEAIAAVLPIFRSATSSASLAALPVPTVSVHLRI